MPFAPNWLTGRFGVVNAIGLFEAKTKLSEICAEVAAKGVSVLVTRRGKPLVRIEPLRPTKSKAKGVWDRRAALIKARGPFKEDVDLPPRSKQAWRNPLDD